MVLPPEKPRHPDEIFAVEQPQCMTNDFPRYWNLVSIPVRALADTPDAVFGDDVPFLYMFAWDGEGYVEPEHVLPTEGYWIYLSNASTLDVCGTLPETDVEFELGDAGWYIISTPTIPVYLGYIRVTYEGYEGEPKPWPEAVEAGWVRPFAYGYDPEAGGYYPVGFTDLLDPWYGYWIKTLKDGVKIILPIEYMLTNPPAPPETLSLSALGPADELPPPPPPPPSTDTGALTVVNVPNPVRDVSTTTFRVLGGFVQAIRVRIYDLSGRLVYKAEGQGNELVWHTQNLAGEYLANGVYLYRVEAKVAGQWIALEVKKLAIYR